MREQMNDNRWGRFSFVSSLCAVASIAVGCGSAPLESDDLEQSSQAITGNVQAWTKTMRETLVEAEAMAYASGDASQVVTDDDADSSGWTTVLTVDPRKMSGGAHKAVEIRLDNMFVTSDISLQISGQNGYKAEASASTKVQARVKVGTKVSEAKPVQQVERALWGSLGGVLESCLIHVVADVQQAEDGTGFIDAFVPFDPGTDCELIEEVIGRSDLIAGTHGLVFHEFSNGDVRGQIVELQLRADAQASAVGGDYGSHGSKHQDKTGHKPKKDRTEEDAAAEASNTLGGASAIALTFVSRATLTVEEKNQIIDDQTGY